MRERKGEAGAMSRTPASARGSFLAEREDERRRSRQKGLLGGEDLRREGKEGREAGAGRRPQHGKEQGL